MMTNTQHDAGPTSGSPPDETSSGGAESAKQQVRAVADTGKEQAANVVGEAKAQTTQLLDEARGQARDHADGQVSQLAGFLDRMSGELGEMADGTSDSSGYLTALARDGSSTAKDLSRRLEERGLDGALDDVRRFARRRPVAFLGAAFGVGLLLGRLTRNADLGEIVGDDASTSRSNGSGRTSDSDVYGGGMSSDVSVPSSLPTSSSTTTSPTRPDVPGEPALVPPNPRTAGAGTPPEAT